MTIFEPLSEEMRKGFRKAVIKKLDRLLAMPDAEPYYADTTNCVFFGMIPNDAADKEFLLDVKKRLDGHD